MVGFYGIEALGWLNHQFVFQEHRNKGLGTLMEIAHAQNCIRRVPQSKNRFIDFLRKMFFVSTVPA